MKNEFIFTTEGDIIIDENDNPDEVIDIIIENSEYDTLETGMGKSFSPDFIENAMYSGFYITSYLFDYDIFLDEAEYPKNVIVDFFPILNLWKTQTVLFFDNLHESKSTSRIIKDYELRINYNFTNILRCIIERHGDSWITPPLQKTLKKLNNQNGKAKAISFEVYKNGELKAGEIGIKTGKIYTSYSGFYNESSAGSVQLLMMLRYLRDNDYLFCNFGTDNSKKNNKYKVKLGASYIDRKDFIELWRQGRD
jgi:Leu/Phe-tRNA-protein transferase